jgi:hypothetical protein
MGSDALRREVLMMKRWVMVAAVFVGAELARPAIASAQIDLTGSWASRMHEDWMERCCGRDLGDYTGLPINDEARAKALSWDASLNSLRERQCLFFSPWAGQFQPQGVRIWSEIDDDGAIRAWKMSGNVQKDVVTIWMDGRPHPSANAFYPFSGFTTGRWEGDTLVAYTTHMKTSVLRRANGVPKSDMATATAYITRHDDLLTVVTVEDDPIYLTEPLIVSRTFQLDPRGNIDFWTECNAVTEIPRLEGTGIVPHYLPGENPNLHYMERTYHIPPEAAMGYAETLYPEYRRKLKDAYVPPVSCTRYCCGWLSVASGSANPAPNLRCVAETNAVTTTGK